MGKKLSLKGAWLPHVTHFKFWRSHPYFRNGRIYSCQISYTRRLYQVILKGW